MYFGSKQHTSLEGEPRDYNNHKFYHTNFNSKCHYKLSLRIQLEYLRILKVDKFFRVFKQQKRKQYLATIYDIMMKPVHDVNLSMYSKRLSENKVTSKTEYTNT